MIENQKTKSDFQISENNQWEDFRDILDYCPTDKFEKFLSHFSNSNILREFLIELKKINTNDTNIIISLSGGVDSCTSLYLLKYFYPNNNLVAVFINYNNRKESNIETKFIKKYCDVLGVNFFHRKVNEISRNDCHLHGIRDIYESLTKDIRFDTYRQISDLKKDMKNIVLLGHNKDDCFENIITNISAKHNYENLSGTDSFVTIDGIDFWRPLLKVQKSEIIDFANKVNIPYLVDSTPKWSTRGKIRDNVLVSLKDINPDIMTSFFELQNHIKDSNNIIKSYVLPNILEKVKRENNTNTIFMEFAKHELFCVHNIWKIVLKTLFEDDKITYKSIQQFIEYIERFKNKFKKMSENNIINYKTKFILNNNISVNIFRNRQDNICLSFCKT